MWNTVTIEGNAQCNFNEESKDILIERRKIFGNNLAFCFQKWHDFSITPLQWQEEGEDCPVSVPRTLLWVRAEGIKQKDCSLWKGKTENYVNQSIRKLHSHQEKELLLQQEAAFFCSCPAQSLLKATQTLPTFHLLCRVGNLLFISVSCSSLCSILWQSTDHLSLLFGACIRGWCCGYRILRDLTSGLGHPLCRIPPAESFFHRQNNLHQKSSWFFSLPVFLLGSCSQPRHSGG